MHAFQKKAKKGGKTPKRDIELIQRRLEAALRDNKKETDLMAEKTRDTRIEESSGNVFADLGFPHADREQLKAKLMLEIYRAIKDRRLTQVAAGEVLGIQQPHVSALMNGRSGNYSLGRLFEFLNALGRDVEIAVRPKAPRAEVARTRVVVQSS